MADNQDPIVLELAHVAREQMGPFLVLGLDKDASKDEIEAHWADRLKSARKQQFSIPLEDVNWAREMLGDPQRRLRADAGSLNVDLSDALLEKLAQRYGAWQEGGGPAWQPLDDEKSLADYVPAVEVPDAEAVRAALAVPEVPEEVPAILGLLEELARAPLDPWGLSF